MFVFSLSVIELAQRFDVCRSPEALMEEYQDYQLSPASELPEFVTEDTRLDTFWFGMGSMKLPTGKARFENLAALAIAVLCLPHSNADPERCFSILRKIQTDQRGNLGLHSVNSLMSVKFNMDIECFRYSPGQNVLLKAKSACTDYLKGKEKV